jgi:cullin-associated NEDD8-dissociated protein 1
MGLWMLNPDGTRTLDKDGQPVPSYTNEEIESYAKAWTGFVHTSRRSNVQDSFWVDPMELRSQFDSPGWPARTRVARDLFPKASLLHGYVGDTYPLCNELPARSFLRPGARYSFRGTTPRPLMQNSYGGHYSREGYSPRLHLRRTSNLYAALCGLIPGDPLNEELDCTYQPELALSELLGCDGHECDLQTSEVSIVKLDTPQAVVYYEYLRIPCVELTFYPNPMRVRMASGGTSVLRGHL